jgi:putative oxygen-independent coproporphyrinogen III oxidase
VTQASLENLRTEARLDHPPPLSLYVHVPWCARKCPYCDFNSHELRGELPEQRYLSALIADLEHALPWVWGRPVHSVFLGGGTPSLLTEQGVDALLCAIRTRLSLTAEAEITLEANPGTFEQARFAAYRQAGVNRLSIGIQSFNDGHLQALGRIHDSASARKAVDIAARHFDNFNLDLMYGLPDQKGDEAMADIEMALTWEPPHLSCYQLTLEPNTPFFLKPPSLPDPDEAASFGEAIEERLVSAGYRHYETSAFTKPRFRSVHNLNYWTFGDYLGIGPGAHSKLSFQGRIIRQMRYKHPETFMRQAMAGSPIQEEHPVQERDLPFEFMMNALRLCEGVPLDLFSERTGLPLSRIAPTLQLAESKGLIERDWRSLKPTSFGQKFLNELLQLFLPDT